MGSQRKGQGGGLVAVVDRTENELQKFLESLINISLVGEMWLLGPVL